MNDGQTKVKNSVTDIEKSFNVEVLTMIVQSSTPTGHVKWILFLFFVSVALSFNFALFFEDQWLSRSQEVMWIIIEFMAAIGLAAVLSKMEFFQRFLTSDQDEVRMVEARAENEFFKNNFYKTQKRNGILFFISKMEKRVHIVADEKLSKILSDQDKQLLLQVMVENLKKHLALEDVFVKTLEVFKQELAVHAKTHKQLIRDETVAALNELANETIIKD